MLIFGQSIPKHSAAAATSGLSAESVLQFCLRLVIRLDKCSPFSPDLSPSLDQILFSVQMRVAESPAALTSSGNLLLLQSNLLMARHFT